MPTWINRWAQPTLQLDQSVGTAHPTTDKFTTHRPDSETPSMTRLFAALAFTALTSLGLSAFAQNSKVEEVVGGLSNPCGVAVQPGNESGVPQRQC